MTQRILVTGGAGFIGSHLVERLHAGGHSVYVLDDLSRGRRAWLPEAVGLDVADVRDRDAVRAVVVRIRPRTVVHLAAMHFIPAVDGAPELARDVNVEGTRAVLDALAAAPPARLLFASTAAVYPDRSGPIPETCPPAPLDVYGETKLEGERLVEGFGAETGTEVVVARIFNVVGRRETNAHVVPELVEQVRRAAAPVRLGNLTPRRDYTDVRDVAAALAALLALAPPPARVNVGSGRGVSVGELVAACGRAAGRPIEVEVEPTRLRTHDRQELVADSGLLHSLTGWEPRWSLEETLGDLLAQPE